MAKKGLVGKAILSQDLKCGIAQCHSLHAVYNGLQETASPLPLSLTRDTPLCLFYTTDISPCQTSPHDGGTRDQCLAHSRCAFNDCQLSEACTSPVANFSKKVDKLSVHAVGGREVWRWIKGRCVCGVRE